MTDSVTPSLANRSGDEPEGNALFASLYSHLRRIAKRELVRHGARVSVSPTTLLHEAYLDMSGRDSNLFPDQARFLGYAARVMRGLVIDYARSRHAIKRGGHLEITSLDSNLAEPVADAAELTRISEALDELAATDTSLAELVDLKFFCGFSFAEIAGMRGLSERTVQRQWEKARIYLYHSLRTREL